VTARRQAALLLFAVLCACFAPRPADAQPTAPTAIGIELMSQSAFVAADEPFQIELRITGSTPNDRIRVNVHPLVRTRADLRRILDTGTPPRTILSMYPDVEEAVVDPVTRRVTITVPSSSPTRQPGVYPLSVTVGTGSRAAQPLISALTRVGPLDAQGGPLGLALVLPITTAPVLQPDFSSDLPVAELERIRSLALAFIDRYPSLPLTLAPNPETLDALDGGSPEERAVLQLLRQAARGRTVLGTTFVPVDAEAWRSNGLGLALLDQHDNGLSTIDRTLGSAQTRRAVDIAITGASDTPATLELRRALGASWLVVPEDGVQPLEASRFPSNLQQSFVLNDSTGTPMRAMTTDGRLSFLAGALAEPTLAARHTWITHLLLADVAAGYFEQPRVERGTVVVLPDTWTMTPAVDSVLLPALATLPFVRLVALDELFTTVSRASPTGTGARETAASGPLRRTLQPAPAMRLDDYPSLLTRVSQRLRGFESVVGANAPQVTDLRDLIAVSGDARLGAADRRAYLIAVDDAMVSRLRTPDGRSGIIAPQAQRVTLTSRRATIPIDVENRLAFDATVRIEVRADKLDFPRGDLLTTTLKPGLNSIEIEVRTRTSGDSPLEIVIGVPDADSGFGQLATSTFTIRSTALSGVGLAISILALLVLVTWWARHVRRTRAARRVAERAETSGPLASGTTIDESLTPSEP
jgi:hypothetical protein